jgi:hypothetical protein
MAVYGKNLNVTRYFTKYHELLINILVKSGMIFHLQLKVHIKMKFNICFGWVFYKTIDRIGEL